MKKTLFILTMLIGSFGFSQSTYYVDQSATTGLNDGTSWVNAYTNIEAAVFDAATEGDVDIWVKEGVYTPSVSEDNIFIYLTNGIYLYGGFDGTETNLSERDPKNNITILDGDTNQDDNGAVDVSNSSRSDNAYTVVYMYPITSSTDRGVLIDGFTIRGGNSKSTTIYTEYRYGGGVFINADHNGSTTAWNTAKVKNCIIENNSAWYNSGISTRAMNQIPILAAVENTIFRGNHSVSGVVGNNSIQHLAVSLITNCLFEGNEVTSPATGVIISNGTENQNYSSGVFLINSTLTGNTIASNKVLSVYNPFSSVISARTAVYNSIFSEPMADTLLYQYGAGIADTCVIENNVINSADLLVSGNFAHILSSNNLIATSPGFVGGGNYELTASSPAIGLGELVDYNKFYLNLNLPFTAPIEDLGGNMIPTSGTNLDAGAYQYVNTASLEENIVSTIQSIYPNPTSSELNIQVDKNVQIQIYNSQGATIYSQQLSKGTNQIDTKNLSPGMYFIQTEAGEYHKFIKK